MRRLAAAFARDGAAVSVFSLGRGTASSGGSILPEGADVIFGDRRGPYDPRPLLPLAQTIRRLRPAAVVTFDRHAWLYSLVSRASGRSKVPIVNRALETHGLVTRSARIQLAAARRLLRRSDVVVAVSQPLVAFMREEWRIPDVQLCRIPVGLDITRFSPDVMRSMRDPTRARLCIPRDAPVLAQIGNLSPNKNHEMTLHALADLVRSDFPDCRLLVIGTAERARERSLSALAARLGVADHVSFLGLKEDVRPYLAAADLLVLTSRAEAAPNVVLEALACEVPAVVTHYASAAEQLGSGLSHLCVPQGDTGAFVSRVASLLKNPSERARLGAIGRARVVAAFSFDRAIADWRAVLLANGKGRWGIE